MHAPHPACVEAAEGSAENLIAEVGISTRHRKPSTTKQSNEKFSGGPSDIGPGPEDLIRRGAREVIRQAIAAALAKIIHYDPLFMPYAKKTMYSLRRLGNEPYISPFQVRCMLQGRQPWRALGANADIRAKN